MNSNVSTHDPAQTVATVTHLIRHQPWCTDHLSEDPNDPLTEGVDECVAVLRVLEPHDGRPTLDLMVELDGQGRASLSVESDSRPMTLLEVERLYVDVGRALELMRRSM